MRKDAVVYAQKCDSYQRHSNILSETPEPICPIVFPCLFMKWGIDIVDKLLKASRGKVFMLAVTNYFFKWTEAKAFAQGDKNDHFHTSYSQANGQADSTNKIINNLKKKMGTKRGTWAEELPFVLWADRTSSKDETG
ncbi:uncharacterized protein LOC143589229 [Bidens hawaiensis]|uniref:uncharacterized protein LOC143589229 n=1 Tax=Bidens hawaiensis TaxID=980011 RepID=UPI00404B9198